jgi:uncharacterized membrane protein YcjF (UPF0283 family)
LRKILLFAIAFVTLALATIVVNQTLQLSEFAGRFHPTAGTVVFWMLLAAYVVCLAVPVVLYQRLPAALKPPEATEGPEFEQHLRRLRKRLAANPRTAELALQEWQEIEQAVSRLDEDADELTKHSASRVFLTTAVSQNGSLDALVVLAAQLKLVWDIAHVYHQRPSLRDMGSLYANVLGTAFIAGQLEDVDLSEQIQPVLSTVLGSAASAVPGLQAASTVALTSVITGSANAFLTLRVGIIAREYSRSMTRHKRAVLRRSATATAALMLGSVVTGQAARVTSAIVKASGRSVGSALSGIGSRVKNAGASLANRLPFGQGGPRETDGSE